MAGVVVVGVDGSQHSLVALRLAASEARCRSARLHVVSVYGPVRTSQADVAAVVAGEASSSIDTDGRVRRRGARRCSS